MRRFVTQASMLLLSMPLFAAEQTEKARTLTESPLSAVNLLQTLMGLLLVLACVVLVAWLLKRTNSFHTAANSKLKVITGIPLGSRERAVLVQIGDEQILLGVTPQQINTLHKLETPLSVANSNGISSDFAGKLRKIMQQRGDK
ncbi:Flagellar biosynthesis protein FliO [Methylophaga thiooxydans]|uniref:Flagellar protein n=1 Tax=Methylophaga thiooxydans TaxID=392484 RepID=A0A0A0BHK1_9GAMM|nr:flagellar biosynthetic protein FliO [Methylophaga thiooxydans]KGM07345.1 Flagellar biosynthesis protein FliO [Methylophaga thiooxydans]